MNKAEIKQFVKDRDTAIKRAIAENNLDIFKEFYKGYAEKGFYDEPLPIDDILEISLRKSLYHMTSASPIEKINAKIWLEQHGSSTKLF